MAPFNLISQLPGQSKDPQCFEISALPIHVRRLRETYRHFDPFATCQGQREQRTTDDGQRTADFLWQIVFTKKRYLGRHTTRA